MITILYISYFIQPKRIKKINVKRCHFDKKSFFFYVLESRGEKTYKKHTQISFIYHCLLNIQTIELKKNVERAESMRIICGKYD